MLMSKPRTQHTKMLKTAFDEKNKIWYGAPRPIDNNVNNSLGHRILKALARNPHKVIQVSDDNGVCVTAAEMRLKTIRAAQNLQKLGYHCGDIFTTVSDNNYNLAPIVFASICLGCPVNTLVPMFHESEIKTSFQLIEPKLVFCTVKSYDKVRNALIETGNEAKIFTMDGQVDDSLSVENLFEETTTESDFRPVDVHCESHAAFIVFTSGSTGPPKGVCISHASMLDSDADMDWTEDDVIFSFSTLYWGTGLYVLLTSTFAGAKRIITTIDYSPKYFLHIVEKYKVTITFAAPYYLTVAAKCNAVLITNQSSIRQHLCGGGKLSPEVFFLMNKFLPNGKVCITYGSSELGLIAVNYSKSHPEAVGQLNNNLTVKIVNSNGERCGIDVDGEIRIKTPIKFLGYYNNAKATLSAVDNEGFVCTGDIGHFDTDGYLYIIDREKDIFKHCNYQISPSELEGVLLQLDGIESVCVVGIPDELTEALPAAVIVRKKGVELNQKDVHRFAAENFDDEKQLCGGVYFVEHLPLTLTGKVIRREALAIAVELYNQRNNVSGSRGQPH